jgi:hypothetical protein
MFVDRFHCTTAFGSAVRSVSRIARLLIAHRSSELQILHARAAPRGQPRAVRPKAEAELRPVERRHAAA